MRRVWSLRRNNVDAAVAWVREHLGTTGAPPHPDDMAVLLQLQDDPDELERRLREFLPGGDPAPVPVPLGSFIVAPGLRTIRYFSPTSITAHEVAQDWNRLLERSCASPVPEVRVLREETCFVVEFELPDDKLPVIGADGELVGIVDAPTNIGISIRKVES